MFDVSDKPDTSASFTNKNKYWAHSLNTWFLALSSHSVPRNPLHQHTFPQNRTKHPVKDTVKFTLEQATKAQRKRRGTALLLL